MNNMFPQWFESLYILIVYGFIIVWILKFSFWIARGFIKIIQNTIDPDNMKNYK